MKVGTILLTKDNQYVKDEGSLPTRPEFDKGLLTGLLSNPVQLVSLAGYNMLPESMQQKCITMGTKEYTFPITISEIAASDLLLVSISEEVFIGGKKFRLDNFKCLVKTKELEVWIRK